MKKNIKEIVVVSSVLSLIILAFIFVYVFTKKYDDVKIISIRKEYNLVFDKEDDVLEVPLYLSRKNTFLSNIDQISQIYLSNDDTKFVAYAERVDEGIELEYNKEKYYEYIYNLSFNAYDEFSEPIFMPDAKINIIYKNDESISLGIGNMCLYFNKKNNSLNDLIVTKLSSVTNVIDDKETIVGINIKLYNNTSDVISLNSIKLYNKFYDFDYMNYENKTVDNFLNLKERNNDYSYTALSIPTGDMKYKINPEESFEAFIPMKYIKNIYIVDRLPLYIDYQISDESKTYVLDDFQFIRIVNHLAYNGIETYVYSYK